MAKFTPGEGRRIVAKNTRLFREVHKWSQEQLAERCGLHRTYIGSIERGERNVSIDNIERIAHALGIKAHQLIDPQLYQLIV